MVMVDDILGRGLSIPFRRDRQRDFAAASGEALVRSAVAQVLGTVGASDFTQGELPWRTEFGSLLHLLRHQKNDVALREMAKVYVQDALRRWEPRIMVTRLDAERLDDSQGSKLVLRLRYNVIQRNVPGNQVLLEGIEQTIAL
jgi:phage baseplate assembly protein W